MDYNESNDWKTIAHDEYENRKKIELQLSRISAEHKQAQYSLQSANNYNQVLEQKIKSLEEKFTKQESTLKQCIELLRKAKLLISKRKEELEQITIENAELKHTVNKKSALLEAEMLQHEKTNHKLATTLSKLTAATAAAVTAATQARRTITARKDTVIYAEGPVAEKPESEDANFIFQIIASPPAVHEDSNSDAAFMDQVFYLEQQHKNIT